MVPNFESYLTLASLPDMDPFSEPILIPVFIDLEHEPPILERHIPLRGKECEFQLFDLEPTLESKPTLEAKLYLSFILESVLVS